jgi:hypothetical protein
MTINENNKEFYSLILKKLEAIERNLDHKEEQIKSYLAANPDALKSADVLLAGLRSTRTSFEVLRDEIDEMHQLTIALSREGRGGGSDQS